jgi:hypothetical protein
MAARVAARAALHSALLLRYVLSLLAAFLPDAAVITGTLAVITGILGGIMAGIDGIL